LACAGADEDFVMPQENEEEQEREVCDKNGVLGFFQD
jgi:hypothetical protein